MDTFSIALAEAPDEIRARLDAALAPLRAQGMLLDVSEGRRGTFHVLVCRAQTDAAAPARPGFGGGPAFRQALAAATGAWILERGEPALLRRLLAAHYSYLSPEEREGILARAAAALAGGGSPAAGRRAEVVPRLLEYLERHTMLNLDGFVTFRLKDYVDELIAALDRAVDGFLLEKEHGEFIDLLRHVVDSRPDRPAVVHCLWRRGAAALEDDDGRAIGADLLAELGPVATSREIAEEDLLISALITLAPRQVRLHLPADPGEGMSAEARGTLDAVFPRGVQECRGCARCRRPAQGAAPRP